MTRAQTNLQLFEQLRGSGFADTDLALVRDAYELAMCLFSASYRPSGKTFVAHVVGTASIVARSDGGAGPVAAALLHAAYTRGVFGFGGVGPTATKRALVRRAVGAETEELVARYAGLAWYEETIERLISEVAALDREDRDVVLIRLANELDELLDLAPLYCRDADRRREKIRSEARWQIALAERMGLPELARELDEAARRTLESEIPASCRLRPERFSGRHAVDPLEVESGSYLVPPASHRMRIMVAARLFVRRSPPLRALYRTVRSFVGRCRGQIAEA